ncbi:MAG: OmpH family outer membrane protein [Sneathiella sp.]|nr:OmpH family outer membrane protein [Sneathiella sp.]
MSARNIFAAVALAGAFLVNGSFVGGMASANAQEIPVAKIAIVDVANVMAKSRAWNEAKTEIEGQVGQVRSQVEAERARLQTEAEELKRQQAILAPDVFQQRVGALQQEQRNLQVELQKANRKLNTVLGNLRGKLSELIVKTAAGVAQEKGLNIGVDRANVLFFNDAMDISDEVLKRFDASDVKIEKSQ